MKTLTFSDSGRVGDTDHTATHRPPLDFQFPQSSIDAIVQKMLDSKEAIGRAVIKYDKGDGVLTIPQLAQLCKDCDLGLSPQEFLTLKRKLDRKKKDKFVYSKLLKLLTDEPMPTAH